MTPTVLAQRQQRRAAKTKEQEELDVWTEAVRPARAEPSATTRSFTAAPVGHQVHTNMSPFQRRSNKMLILVQN